MSVYMFFSFSLSLSLSLSLSFSLSKDTDNTQKETKEIEREENTNTHTHTHTERRDGEREGKKIKKLTYGESPASIDFGHKRSAIISDWRIYGTKMERLLQRKNVFH